MLTATGNKLFYYTWPKDEKNGVPPAAAPKAFMQYLFVNTVTGEKSGEMLDISEICIILSNICSSDLRWFRISYGIAF